MKKWLGLLIIAIFGCSAITVFADDQAAVSAAASDAAQPVPVPQGDSAAQGPASEAAPVAAVKAPINFGDYRSTTLATKAWQALAQNDIESVLAYTNKCISLYAAQAAKMQAGLKDYATGSNDDIFKYWALNDVATSYYIQGEAYRAANMKDEAKEAYTTLINNYSFGQAWDTKGWFWKPAAAAKEKLEMMASGANWDFGDYTSSTLVKQAWAALAANDLKAVQAYVNKAAELYGDKAKEMQAGLKDYATGSNDAIFKYWALNDVATGYFILGKAYQSANMKDKAKEAYTTLINNYSFGQAWDPKGWFWKPADGAKEQLDMMAAGTNWDFGDYTSSTLVQKAWAALAANDLNAVQAYANKTVELYAGKAKEMQASLKEYPWESKEKTMSYWALNDVSTALFILGEAYQNAGKKDEATSAYKRVINEFFYGQCWDPGGWFWKPSEAAQQKLGELDNV